MDLMEVFFLFLFLGKAANAIHKDRDLCAGVILWH